MRLVKALGALSSRGDTIVEVMLAMSLLTSVLFTSWGATNRSSQLNLAARQRIVMVNQLKEQAEILKAKRASTGASYLQGTVATMAPTSTNPCDAIANANQTLKAAPPLNEQPFYYAKNTSNVVSKVNGAKTVNGNSNAKVWVQRVDGQSDGGDFTDFYVRGCWVVTGGTQHLENSQLLVRINS